MWHQLEQLGEGLFFLAVFLVITWACTAAWAAFAPPPPDNS